MTDANLELQILMRSLQRLGWTQVGDFREVIQYWGLEGALDTYGAPDEIIVPVDPSTSDFSSLLAKAQGTLLQLYGNQLVTLRQLIEIMITEDLSEVLLRRDTGDSSGIIDWVGGNNMVESAQGMLVASAKATSGTRRRFANAETTIADEFLAACRMGQTQIGSYVVTALAPARRSFSNSRTTLPGDTKGSVFQGKQILETLVTALEASSAGLEQARKGEDIEVFESLVPYGVSFELMRSLGHLVSTTVDSGIHIQINGEELLIDKSAQVLHEFVFTPEDAEVIVRATKYFASPAPPKMVGLQGEVVLLKNSAKGAEHQIKLSTKLNGQPRTVAVNLTAAQYDEALRAHAEGKQLAVNGEVTVKQRSALIYVAERVHVDSASVEPGPPGSESDVTSLLLFE